MRFVILAFATLAALHGAEAQPYCAAYEDGTKSCGIPTLQECTRSISGVGGTCIVDDTAELRPPIKGPIQRWLEQESAYGRPRSPELDDVPPPPIK
jgi:hypothetical protein